MSSSLLLSPQAQAMFEAFSKDGRTDDPNRLVGLAQVFHARGWRADAAALCFRTVALARPGTEADTRARELLAKGVPRWHVPLLHDTIRAEAYDRAIRRAVRPGMLVLDIGTGSGVLALMAARAGAEHVIACEQDPVLATVARENVRRNGFADRVTVVARNSKDLSVGADLPRRADLLVSEIVSDQLLGEGVLDTVAHARTHLLTAEAPAIPIDGEVLVALAEGGLARRAPVGDVLGLDLSFINQVRGVRQADPAAAPLQMLSEARPILAFDFTGRQRATDGTGSCTLQASRPATSVGLLQSMRLRLDEETTLSTETPWPGCAWGRHIFCFPEPRQFAVGDSVTAHAIFSSDGLLIWPTFQQ